MVQRILDGLSEHFVVNVIDQGTGYVPVEHINLTPAKSVLSLIDRFKLVSEIQFDLSLLAKAADAGEK
jgi:hypothetical protein